jgi:ubiquinone/menaquinone biosynthesis C-methylase UbiE
VLEHVTDIDEVLREFSRVIRARGYLFIQIDPLFHSPYGSHLQRLIDVPWAHLLYDEPEFIRLALNATDKVPLDQQDTLYRNHAFDDVKRYLISEYRRLNRIRADQLIELVSASGFDLLSTKLIEAENVCPDNRLLQVYPRDLLMTQQVVLLGQKKGPTG